jgi:hypothetical protein
LLDDRRIRKYKYPSSYLSIRFSSSVTSIPQYGTSFNLQQLSNNVISDIKSISSEFSNRSSISTKPPHIYDINSFAMAAKKILVVFGATGVQGGSVVKAVLGDAKMRENWTVRGVTRDVSKPSAKKLESIGAETVAVSNDAQTLDPEAKYIFTGGSEQCLNPQRRYEGCLCSFCCYQLLGEQKR